MSPIVLPTPTLLLRFLAALVEIPRTLSSSKLLKLLLFIEIPLKHSEIR
jgi:hypothetical protein